MSFKLICETKNQCMYGLAVTSLSMMLAEV